MFDDVMTLYNYYKDVDGNEHWKRTVIQRVQWDHGVDQTVAEGSVLVKRQVESITISFATTRQYIKPVAFNALGNKGDYWTLDTKTKLDVVVCGECTEEISMDYKLSNLKKDYEVFTVTSVSDNTNKPFLKNIKMVAT